MNQFSYFQHIEILYLFYKLLKLFSSKSTNLITLIERDIDILNPKALNVQTILSYHLRVVVYKIDLF